MSKFNYNKYCEIKESMDNMSADLLYDLSSEMLFELFNGKYTTDEERVKGIIEAITLVSKVKIK